MWSGIRKSTLFLLCLLVMSSLVVDTFKLTRDNGWGDDFAAYIMQAQSIAEGRMDEFVQRNAFTIENSSRPIGPVTEPWGFPLLLAPAYAIFGLKILALKFVVTACFTVFLIVFFFLARVILADTESLLITAVVAFNIVRHPANAVLNPQPPADHEVAGEHRSSAERHLAGCPHWAGNLHGGFYPLERLHHLRGSGSGAGPSLPPAGRKSGARLPVAHNSRRAIWRFRTAVCAPAQAFPQRVFPGAIPFFRGHHTECMEQSREVLLGISGFLSQPGG